VSEFVQQLVNGFTWGSVYALIALGYTMVYGILRLINFAHGDVFMMGSFAGYYGGNFLLRKLGPGASSSPLHAATVLLFSMIVCAILGYLIERIAYRPLRNAPRIASLITAIGVSFLLEYGGQMVFGPDPKFFPALIKSEVINLGAGVVTTNYQLIVLGVSIVFMGLLQYIVYGTKFGRAMRAVSFNFETASLMGIPTDRVISITFIIGSMLAAVGGILYGLSYPRIDPLMGIRPGLKAFVAAVLGGIGNVPGAMLGGLLIGIIEAFVGGSRFSSYRDAIAFVILIVILLFRPSGLFGKYEPEKV
jgi:branched-chain amino acid transport system permease protein